MLNMYNAELSKIKHILPPVSALVKCGTSVIWKKGRQNYIRTNILTIDPSAN